MSRSKKTEPDSNSTESKEPIPESKETTSKPNKSPKLLPITGNYCPNCKDHLHTGKYGGEICPIKLEGCPRNEVYTTNP